MSRYIDADKLRMCYERTKEQKDNGIQPICQYASVQAIIDQQPTADVVEVVHGKWIYKTRTKGSTRVEKEGENLNRFSWDSAPTIEFSERQTTEEPYCSVCGMWNDGMHMNYCGNCGADMREE